MFVIYLQESTSTLCRPQTPGNNSHPGDSDSYADDRSDGTVDWRT